MTMDNDTTLCQRTNLWFCGKVEREWSVACLALHKHLEVRGNLPKRTTVDPRSNDIQDGDTHLCIKPEYETATCTGMQGRTILQSTRSYWCNASVAEKMSSNSIISVKDIQMCDSDDAAGWGKFMHRK